MKGFLKIEFSSGRIYGLDILRALAILFVVISHGGHLLPEGWRAINNLFVFDGVSIFFVLSGFLIGGIFIKLLETQEINTKLIVDFWIRRWFRTLPNYYLILLLLIALKYIFADTANLGYVYKYFFFSQNLFHNHPWFFTEAWSLSIEEWFYLLTPLLIFFLIKFTGLSPRKSLVLSAVSLLIAVTFFRYFRYLSTSVETLEQWDFGFRKQVFTRLDSLMYGVIGAYIQFYYGRLWEKYKRLTLYAGLCLFMLTQVIFSLSIYPINGLYSCVFSFSVVSLATLFLLPFLSNFKTGSGMIYRAVTYISLISYSMYLINLSLVQTWIIDQIGWNPDTTNAALTSAVNYVLFWVLTIVLSIVIYKYYEVPMMKLRDRKYLKNLFRKSSLQL